MAATDEIRSLFPALSRKVYGKNLVYFDNAATVQRPQSVIDCWNRITRDSNANIHRAVHLLAEEATDAYESARDAVRNFINASSREEVIFTSGATASINLVAFSFGEAFVGEGDEVIVSEAEHHSDIVPWQMMCRRRGAALKVLPVDDTGHLRLDLLDSLITSRTRIVAVTHISNVLGLINPVKDIVTRCHSEGVPVLIDGAQGIVHLNVDVQDLDCDFYAFSGHKMYAVPGTGVLYGKMKWLERMPPFMTGGEMVGTVSFSGTTFAPLPMKFEEGTQNFSGAATLKTAVDMALIMRGEGVGVNDGCCVSHRKELLENEAAVRDYLLDKLLSDNRIHLYGIPSAAEEKIPLFSFTVEGVHHEDLALILDKMGIALRSGQMCAEPLMDRFGVTGMLRASLVAYNTMEEAEYFISSLEKAIKMLV